MRNSITEPIEPLFRVVYMAPVDGVLWKKGIRDFRYYYLDLLDAFGFFAVTAGVVCYALEKRSRWFILAFAFSCALGSIYGFLQGAWPFGLVEIVWTVAALRRWSTWEGPQA